MDRHVMVAGELDRPEREDPASGRGNLEHFLERDLTEPARARHDTRIGGEYARDVGVDLASVGSQGRGEGNRRRVGSAPAESGDVPRRRHPLEAGDDGHDSPGERLRQPGGAHLDDLRLGVRRVRDDSGLAAGE